MAWTKTRRWALVGALAVPTALLVLIWRAAGHRPRLFIGIGAPATAIALSRDGSQIVCTSQNGYLQKWMPDRNRFNSFALDALSNNFYSTTVPPPIELRLSPDEASLTAANIDTSGPRDVLSWAMNTRHPLWILEQRGGLNVTDVNATSSNARFLACAKPQSIVVFDTTKPPPASKSVYEKPADARFLRHFQTRAMLATPEAVNILAFSPDAKRLAFVTYDGTLESWDLTAKQPAPLPACPIKDIATLSFSPDGRFLVASSASDSSDVAILDLAAKTWAENMHWVSSRPAPAFAGSITYSTPPFAPVWMPDSKSLWTGGDKVRQWSLNPFGQKRELPVSGPVAVSGDGTVVATRSVPKAGQPDGIWLWPVS